jgi:hypothetical protein
MGGSLMWSLGSFPRISRRFSQGAIAAVLVAITVLLATQPTLRVVAKDVFSTQAYRGMAYAVNPYGDGRAARRVAAAIEHMFGLRGRPAPFRPTTRRLRGRPALRKWCQRAVYRRRARCPARRGTHKLLISGTSGSLVHQATATLTVR